MIEKPESLTGSGEAARHGLVAAQAPIDLDVVLGRLPASAAGIPAVAHSFAYALSAAGPVRTAQTFLSINQRDGFDCPSCAWADPEEHRAVVELCENGAKALADALTTERVDRAFFDRFSVAELSRQSDQWLNAQGRLVRRTTSRFRGTPRLRALPPSSTRWTIRTQPFSTRRERPRTRRRSCTNFSRGSSAQIICPTARTCATSRAARPFAPASAAVRRR